MAQTSDSAGDKKQAGFVTQVKTMSWNFWVCNIIEAFERLAFFGVGAVRSLYMKNALRLSDSARGGILGTWALIQCLVPMVSGGYTDAYGFRASMMIAFVINIAGYSLMAGAASFWGMLGAACMIGLGTAIFKPPVQGSVAKSLTEENSGLGFGIFYWVVNIGGALAPMAAAAVRGNEANPTWHYVFYGAALVTACNFLPAIFMYREPELDPEARKKSPMQIFAGTIVVLLKDRSMLVFLLIISGFWFMFMQLWDLLPVFIDQWVDARDLGSVIGGWGDWWSKSYLDAEGAAKPELMININPLSIIILVIPLSALFSRLSMMTALLSGMAIATVGFVGAGVTMSGTMAASMIFVFTLGEIICSPKFTEYVGMTAPPDKKALYMGYSNIPFAIGWAGGNFLSGPLYGAMADKKKFATKYLTEELSVPKAEIEALGKGPDGKPLQPKAQLNLLLDKMAASKGLGGGDEVEGRWAAARLLWDKHAPWKIWLILGAIGVASLIGMIAFHLKAKRRRAAEGHGDEPAAE